MNAIRTKIIPLIVALLWSASAAFVAPGSIAQAQSKGDLTSKIRKELVTLPYYDAFDNLAFKIDGSTVTLYGKVLRPTTRSDAERRVARLGGVSRVINNIQVLPPSPFDDSIRRDTYRAIYRTGGLYRYLLGANPSIHIIVDHGHVQLEGVVANRSDAQLAYMAASGVPNAFSVTNNLRVQRGWAY